MIDNTAKLWVLGLRKKLGLCWVNGVLMYGGECPQTQYLDMYINERRRIPANNAFPLFSPRIDLLPN